jgi:phospholipase/lecithinase/hemolysin
MNYKIKIFVATVLFGLIGHVFADQSAINNMIFFGDSLSDIGNNTWILLDNELGTPITNTNSQNRKYLWVNYLVETNLQKPVYPSSQSNLSPFTDNISYAYASANTSNNYLNTDWPRENTSTASINPICSQPGLIKNLEGQTTSTCTPGLLRQVNIYLDNVQLKPNPKTVFFIWAGANDLLAYYTDYMNHNFAKKLFIEWFYLPSPEELAKVEQQAITNILTAKNRLIDAGVKPDMIYILDLPDLSKTPAVISIDSWALNTFYGKENFKKSLSDMTTDFNKKLRSQVEVESYTLPTSHYVQIEKLLNDMISFPKKFNLTNTTESCITKKATPACEGFLFYNEKHPTTFVGKIIAKNIPAFENTVF